MHNYISWKYPNRNPYKIKEHTNKEHNNKAVTAQQNQQT
jgi:hypothetical protein